MVRPVLLASIVAALAVLAEPAPAPAAAKPPGPGWDAVRSVAEFRRAERALRLRGGTIVLMPGSYEGLVVGPRGGAPLRVVGTRGARVGNVLFQGTRNVTLAHVRVRPVAGDAVVEVRGSRNVVLDHLHVSAFETRHAASVLVPDSVDVTIRHSTFTHCGDRAREFTNCVTLWRWSHRVTIERNRFHDCFGCDFVHGRFGTRLTIRNNTFDRALPCAMGKHRCGHNDLVQLFSGRVLRVEGNRFGVYREGGAQLYLTNDVDYATIVNNLFRGTDPKVPGYRARMGLVLGSNESKRLPHYAKVINNTILTGHVRRDGYAGSLRMSSRYGGVDRWKRPIVANNVIALLQQPARVCNSSQRFVANVVLVGRGCKPWDHVGPADLDGAGRPRKGSPVIGAANRHYAPAVDQTGRRRPPKPTIGALEYRP